MATVLYARVSTKEQTLEHQRTDAEGKGFAFDTVVSDHGVSAYQTRLIERPQGRRLFDILRKGDTLVIRFVDRLGRNYDDSTDTLREFMRRGVIVRTINGAFTFDGSETDPMKKAVRDSLIAFMSASAQAQVEATKEAQRAGIDHARRQAEQTAYRGRKPSYTRDQLATVQDMLGQGAAVAAVAKATGLTRQTIYRMKDDPAEAEAALARWSKAA